MSGVAFTQPPALLIPDIAASMNRAIAALPQGASGAIVGVATNTGVNAAVVARVGEDWTVTAWIGKDWGRTVTGGAQIMATW